MRIKRSVASGILVALWASQSGRGETAPRAEWRPSSAKILAGEPLVVEHASPPGLRFLGFNIQVSLATPSKAEFVKLDAESQLRELKALIRGRTTEDDLDADIEDLPPQGREELFTELLKQPSQPYMCQPSPLGRFVSEEDAISQGVLKSPNPRFVVFDWDVVYESPLFKHAGRYLVEAVYESEQKATVRSKSPVTIVAMPVPTRLSRQFSMWVSLTLPKLESEELRTLEKIAEDAEAGPFGTHASFYLSQAGMRELIGAYWKQKLGPEGLRRGDDWQRVKRHSQSLFETEVGFYKQLGLYNLALLDAAVQDYTSFKTRAGQISRLFSSSVPDLLIGRMMHEIDLEKH